MLPESVLKKIKEIELKANQLSNSILIGQHLSRFKGNGVNFSDLHEYKPGDDVRHIAWRQSARSQYTLIKEYEEERDLNIMLVCDISLSGNFGTHSKFNAEAAAEFAATIAMSAIKSGDKVGVVLFSEDIDLFIPPAKGKSHILRIIRDILFFKPSSSKTNLKPVLSKLGFMLPKRSQLFLLTDIWSNLNYPQLSVLAKMHELYCITIFDRAERTMFDLGNVEFNDLESQSSIVVNTSSKKTRLEYEKEMNRLFDSRKRFFQKIGSQAVFINNKGNIFLELIKFYSGIKKKR